MRGSLGYCKLCELADFAHPDLQPVIREVNNVGPEDPTYPVGVEHRKGWEIAMTVRALRDLGAVREDAQVLGVGAGREATIFWLTRHVRRVFATDLYLAGDEAWSVSDARAAMLVAPENETNLGWNPRRLVVQHMDALELRYPDESFDAIFSSSSIEHFGGLQDIRRSVEEMHRVLKPGGVVALATEFGVQGPGQIPGTRLFDEQSLRAVLLDGLDWELAAPLDLSLSEETMASAIPFATPLRRQVADRIRRMGGRGERPRYPHIVLRAAGHLWTSVHVALVKPAG
ncbi:MAG TPA: class I SAM-dependent methyltransferase [Solirubrobacterales bacterium]|nr:class I SAM-dependent methyltransferase [Solirubrobacterales bacterium]